MVAGIAHTVTVAARMAEITGDPSWAEGAEAINTLALEHLMSARRFGFEQFFEPLYAVERIRMSFMQGTGGHRPLHPRDSAAGRSLARGRSICRRRSRSAHIATPRTQSA